MRKTVKFFLKLLCILAFSILVSSKNVDAANVQTLKADTWYEFSLYEDQKDYFTFYAPANKYFRVELIRTSCSMGGVIHNDYYDSVSCDITSNYKRYDEVWVNYGSERTMSTPMCFKKGTKISLSIKQGMDCWAYSATYKIRIKTYATNNLEKENNNTKKKATSLKYKKSHTGILMTDDVDWYVFKAPKTKTYKIQTVQTGDDRFIISYVYKGRKTIAGPTWSNAGSGWINNAKIKLKKGEKIYLKVYYSNARGSIYKVRVK